jgi:cytochrome c-type biogenesis protein CcsB
MAAWEYPALLASFIAYFLAGCLCIAGLAWQRPLAGRLALATAAFGWAATTVVLALRTILAGRPPVASMYEFGTAFVWGTVLYYLYLEYRCRRQTLGLFLLPLAFLLTALFASFFHEARPLAPALKSNWLIAHVAAAVVAYGALAVSFALAVTYLWRHALEEKGDDGPITVALPSLATLDDLANKSILLALPFLTLLILTGAVWAEYAWGSYWRWDPKETWSLITWLVYAVYLHGRAVLGWQGRKSMRWAVAGFAVVLFTFIGVNLLLPGLHSYAR